jgi:Bacterial protein of unknown function (DUF916)
MRQRARFLRLVAAVAAAVLTVLGPAAAYGGPGSPVRQDDPRVWGVRPGGPDGKPDARTHYTLQATPGSTLTDNALVTNLSKIPLTLAVYGTDAFNTPEGQFDLLAADRKPTDIGSWMVFAARSVTVPPQGTVAVPFKIVVPPTATPGDHAGGVVVSMLTLTPGTNKNVNIDARVAVRVYLRVPGNLHPQLKVGPVNARYDGTANPFGRGRVVVGYTVNNPGNIRLQSHPTITVSGPFGELAKVTPKDLPELLPGQSGTFVAMVESVFPSGPLTVTVSTAPFTDPQQPVGQTIAAASGEGYVWAVPWTLLLLILLVLLGGAAFWWVRRRRMISRLDDAIVAAREDALREAKTASATGGRK